MKAKNLRVQLGESRRKAEGAVIPPLILWLLGVPGIVVILLWLFFFRG